MDQCQFLVYHDRYCSSSDRLYVIGLVRRRRRARMGYVGLAYTVSENKFVAYLQKLKYALHVIVRPGDGFWDLKHEKRGDLWSATTILALVMLRLF